MSSNWPLISLAAIVCMKRRFWSVTHGTYSTLCPPITQREAIAAACSAVLPLIALSTKIECPDAASCAAYRTVLSTSPISYSPWGSASNGLYSGICASFSASAASFVPGERVQDGVACRALGQLVDDLATFHQHLRGRVHEAAEDDVTFDFEIGENAGRARCDGREHRGRFGVPLS